MEILFAVIINILYSSFKILSLPPVHGLNRIDNVFSPPTDMSPTPCPTDDEGRFFDRR
jgi:hypothetical protein